MHGQIPAWLETYWAIMAAFIVPIGAGLTWYLFYKIYLKPGKELQVEALKEMKELKRMGAEELKKIKDEARKEFEEAIKPVILKVENVVDRVSSMLKGVKPGQLDVFLKEVGNAGESLKVLAGFFAADLGKGSSRIIGGPLAAAAAGVRANGPAAQADPKAEDLDPSAD